MSLLESQLEQKCKKAAGEHNCLLVKIEKQLGYPDRLLMAANGRVLWIEFKREGEKPRQMQLYIHNMLTEMNFNVLVIDSFSQFIAAMTSLKDLPRLSGNLQIIKIEE